MANDLDAGTTVRALDTPDTVSNEQTGSFTFNSTTFGTDNDSGTYADCGVAFTAPTTGRVIILWRAQMHSTSSYAGLCPVVRLGSTVGAGATVVAASDNNALFNETTLTESRGSHLFVSGLTAGTVYNVRLEHRAAGGVATMTRRAVTVMPAT